MRLRSSRLTAEPAPAEAPVATSGASRNAPRKASGDRVCRPRSATSSATASGDPGERVSRPASRQAEIEPSRRASPAANQRRRSSSTQPRNRQPTVASSAGVGAGRGPSLAAEPAGEIHGAGESAAAEASSASDRCAASRAAAPTDTDEPEPKSQRGAGVGRGAGSPTQPEPVATEEPVPAGGRRRAAVRVRVEPGVERAGGGGACLAAFFPPPLPLPPSWYRSCGHG